MFSFHLCFIIIIKIIIIVIIIIVIIIIILMIIIRISCLMRFYNGSSCYRKKTIKMKKNVKIYQYIIINTKNMTTKFINEIKRDSDSKTIVKLK